MHLRKCVARFVSDSCVSCGIGCDPQIKTFATGGFLTAAKCIKFAFDQGSEPDPAGELKSLPET